MSNFVILSDSCADFDLAMAAKIGVEELLPLTCVLEADGSRTQYADNGKLDYGAFYNALRKGGTSTTSQVNVERFSETFTRLLAQGKDILYIGFSSGLSGTVNAARIAQEDVIEKFPERKIMIVDSLCASLGQGLLIYHATQLKKQGKTMEEIAAWLEENKLHLCHWFTVDDLQFLKRGGRVSGAAAAVGTMLSIKPVMHVDNEGHLIPMEKVRGRRQSLDALVAHMEKTAINPQEQTIFISHGDCMEDAQYVAHQVKAKMNVKDVYIHYVGPVIGSHSGPGTVALFFLGSQR
ncbi:MAG: DegV family protein [Oscillospiraceae bacterium]|nr:DegV family protein [Oscillospiraceae bacterium]